MDRPGKDPGQLRQQCFGFIGVKHRKGQIAGLVRGQAQKAAGIVGVQHDEIVAHEVGFFGEAVRYADGDGGRPLQYQIDIRLRGADAAAHNGFATNRGLNSSVGIQQAYGVPISGDHGDDRLGRRHGAPDAGAGLGDTGDLPGEVCRMDADGLPAVGCDAAHHKVRPLVQQTARGGRQGLGQQQAGGHHGGQQPHGQGHEQGGAGVGQEFAPGPENLRIV